MVYTALLTSININLTIFVLQTNELTITWDVEYNDILNCSGTLNLTYTVNTSNCGMCPPTTSLISSVTCNLTVSDLLAGMCNATVIVHVTVCGNTTEVTSEEYSVRLIVNGKTYYELIRAPEYNILTTDTPTTPNSTS